MGGQMLQPATMQAVAWRRAAASWGCRVSQSRETMQTCLKMGRLVRKQMHKRQQKCTETAAAAAAAAGGELFKKNTRFKKHFKQENGYFCE